MWKYERRNRKKKQIQIKQIQKKSKSKKSCENVGWFSTENVEDFYNKEGYRDGEFKKDDKGTWLIRSEIVKQPKGKVMKTRGMQLYIDGIPKQPKVSLF